MPLLPARRRVRQAARALLLSGSILLLPAATAAKPARAAERERPSILEKELSLFGEEQAEPGEVDLLSIRLDLGKVSVVG